MPWRHRLTAVLILLWVIAPATTSASTDHHLIRSWSRTYDTEGIARAWSIAADQSVVITAVSRIAPNHKELVLLQYSATGDLEWSEQSGQELFEFAEAPRVAIDPSGDRIFTWTDEDRGYTESVVQKRDATGAVLWTHERGCCTYPTAIDVDAKRIAVAYEFDVGPMSPEIGVLDHSGRVICGDTMEVGNPGFRMPAIRLIEGQPWMAASGGLQGTDYNGTITLFHYGENCERLGSTHVGLGGDATATDILSFAPGYAATVGSIEVNGNSDIHLAGYKTHLRLPAWMRTFDLSGSDDVARAADSDGDGTGVVVGTTSTPRGSDVLIGRFEFWDEWWTTFDGMHGDDEGVDVAILPDGRIAVLAEIERAPSEPFESLLLYSAEGTLLGQARNRFVRTPQALAAGDDGAVYTVGTNAAGAVVTSRYATQAAAPRPTTPLQPFVLKESHATSSSGARLTFTLGEASRVRAAVYDIQGRLVRVLRDQAEEAGTYEIEWDGRDPSGSRVASGAYFVRIDAGRHVAARRVLVIW